MSDKPGWSTKVPGMPDPEPILETQAEGAGKTLKTVRTHPAFGVATISRVTCGGRDQRSPAAPANGACGSDREIRPAAVLRRRRG